MTSALIDPRSQDGSATRKMQTGLVQFGEALADLADKDPRIVAGSADLKSSTLISAFSDRHPSRFYQFGISETPAVLADDGCAFRYGNDLCQRDHSQVSCRLQGWITCLRPLAQKVQQLAELCLRRTLAGGAVAQHCGKAVVEMHKNSGSEDKLSAQALPQLPLV